jgi:hypothetical protein
MFPYHEVPDGSIFVPHHFIWAMAIAIIPLLVIWDNDPYREPWLAVASIGIGLIAFIFVWRVHHVLGAAVAVIATIVAAIALLSRLFLFRGDWPVFPIAVALVLVLVASDDVLQHAFGWETPLDWVWKNHLRPKLPSH